MRIRALSLCVFFCVISLPFMSFPYGIFCLFASLCFGFRFCFLLWLLLSFLRRLSSTNLAYLSSSYLCCEASRAIFFFFLSFLSYFTTTHIYIFSFYLCCRVIFFPHFRFCFGHMDILFKRTNFSKLRNLAFEVSSSSDHRVRL